MSIGYIFRGTFDLIIRETNTRYEGLLWKTIHDARHRDIVRIVLREISPEWVRGVLDRVMDTYVDAQEMVNIVNILVHILYYRGPCEHPYRTQIMMVCAEFLSRFDELPIGDSICINAFCQAVLAQKLGATYTMSNHMMTIFVTSLCNNVSISEAQFMADLCAISGNNRAFRELARSTQIVLSAVFCNDRARAMIRVTTDA